MNPADPPGDRAQRLRARPVVLEVRDLAKRFRRADGT